jgi:hypothetical protein
MLCILAFVIFLILFPILGFFPTYRKLFKKAWRCVFLKVQLKPCDVNFGEELKNTIVAKTFAKSPKLAKFLDKTLVFWAWGFVILNIWSLGYVMIAGLNLYVYDTCDPVTGESCSLSGEACGIGSVNLTFTEAFEQRKLGEWASRPFTDTWDTLGRVPSRWKSWEASEYISPVPSYYNQFDESKQTAVEFIDPGCSFCKELFKNIKQAEFEDNYNLTYVSYPIPDETKDYQGGYKFQASYQISSYLEAMKDIPPQNYTLTSEVPADWQLLEILFTRMDGAISLQDRFNYNYNQSEIDSKLSELLSEIGYTEGEIQEVVFRSQTEEIKQRLETHKDIVENKVQTIRIPTIIFDGRRYDRVVDQEVLSN